MRYMMKQKLFSWATDFYIQDDAGQNRFFVDGKSFSIGNQLSFQDLEGHELCVIKREAWSRTYQIFRSEKLWASLEKELLTLFKSHFEVDVLSGGDMDIEGDFMGYRYVFLRGAERVAEVSELFALADSYGVDIAPGQEDVLILACTVVIDLACHQKSGFTLSFGLS